jgi:hypothetical protein
VWTIRSGLGAKAAQTRDGFSGSIAFVTITAPNARATARQIYALAAALCERMGEEFPETRGSASELIERLRIENGHPAPRLEDSPPKAHRRRRRQRTNNPSEKTLAFRELARELRDD